MAADLDVSLKEHFESRLRALEERFRVHERAQEREIDQSRETAEEARRGLREQVASTETVRLRELQLAREVTEQTRQAMDAKLAEMNQFRSQLEGERALYVSREMLDTRLAAISALAETRWSQLVTRLDALERARANLDGRMAALVTFLFILSTFIGWALQFIGKH